MVFLGMDHGTTGISFGIIDDDGKPICSFKIDREDSKTGKVRAIDEIKKRVDLSQIKLLAMTYAMGDGINSITPLEKVKNRGILSINGAGKVTGGGTSVYTEIEESNIPTVLIPGLHKDSKSLDPLFNAAYSHQGSSEKISIAYDAYLKTKWKNMIVADLSSNSVNILIENGKIRGAIDAALGAMGIIHGPIDLDMIRKIDEGKITANEAFSNAGAIKIANINTKVALSKDELFKKYKNKDKKAILAVNTMVMTIAMEIFGLIGISKNKLDGIVLTGSIGSLNEPFNFKDKLNEYLKNKYEITIINSDSGAYGAAKIAKAVYEKEKEILGIPVDC
ncbi:MAG: methanogenesis marker 12 protein [Methanobrevibacter sp.]|jgi:putative methanogenesis marker protein 12|nr:methanogenesis marker 12 protein [Candidatus Methanoflexus mossambicus]